MIRALVYLWGNLKLTYSQSPFWVRKLKVNTNEIIYLTYVVLRNAVFSSTNRQDIWSKRLSGWGWSKTTSNRKFEVLLFSIFVLSRPGTYSIYLFTQCNNWPQLFSYLCVIDEWHWRFNLSLEELFDSFSLYESNFSLFYYRYHLKCRPLDLESI